MAVDIVMPQMGESIFEGTITKWLKKLGEKVERDEPLFEISTDKVDAEIPSPSAGVLKEIKVGEGQTVPIQTVVGVIDAAGSAAASLAPAPAKTAAPAPAPTKAPASTAPVPATSPATGSYTGSLRSDGARSARNGRAARKDVLWQLRSTSYEHHAAAHRRAHGGVEACFRARLLRR